MELVDIPTTVRHQLLCAVPQLRDPNFQHAVVFMLDHDEQGALGLVINHLASNAVDEVARGLGLTWRGDPTAKVRVGGPVQPNRGWIVHDDAHWDPAAQEIVPGLWLTTSLDRVLEGGQGRVGGDATRVLFLLGYAGWAPGQLDGELAAGGWLSVPIRGVTSPAAAQMGVDADWIFDTSPDRMWDDALRSIGIDAGRVVGFGGGRPGSA